MMVNRAKWIGTAATLMLGAAMALTPATAEARPIDRIRGEVGAMRGHAFALRNFMKDRCRQMPQLRTAHVLADRLACSVDDLWDQVRQRDCHLSPAQISGALQNIRHQHAILADQIHAAERWAPRNRLSHACHLLERIDHHWRKAECEVVRLPPAHYDPYAVRGRSPYADPGLRLHDDPHRRPHVEPHRAYRPYGYSADPYRDRFEAWTPPGHRYGHPGNQYGRYRSPSDGGFQLRLGRMTFRF